MPTILQRCDAALDSLLGVQIRASGLARPARWLLDTWTGGATVSGESVSPEGALALSAYFAAIRAISEDVGKLPFIVYRRVKPRGKERAREHAAYKLLDDRANDEVSAMTFRETLTHWALGWGGGFAEIVRDGRGLPVAMFPIHPSRVELRRNANLQLVYIVHNDGGGQVTLRQEQMFHLRGLGDEAQGYSVARYAAESIGLGMAAQKFGAALFGNNATLGTVFEHPGTLSEEALANLRESLATIYGGARNAHKPYILEEGMKANKTAIPPEEAQFIETREFQVEDVARWFRIPPNKLGHFKRAQGWSTLEATNTDYITDTLMAWLVRWEQEAHRKLFREDERAMLFAEHLVAGLLRGDQSARGAFYTQMFNVGAMSPNDIREKENENPRKDGDAYYTPSNMTSNEEAEEPEPEQPAPPQPPNMVPQAPEEIAKPYVRLFEDAIGRCLRKEATAAKRAAKKYAGERSQFAHWLGRFYAEQQEHVCDAVSVPAEALADVHDRPAAGVLWANAYALQHVRESQADLLSAFDVGHVEVACADWLEVRAQSAAADLAERIAALAMGASNAQDNQRN